MVSCGNCAEKMVIEDLADHKEVCPSATTSIKQNEELKLKMPTLTYKRDSNEEVLVEDHHRPLKKEGKSSH